MRVVCLPELESVITFVMMKRAAIYARSSPDCPVTADEQIERLETIAAERGWTVTSVCSDRPTTVRKGQERRPGELTLIESIRSGSIEQVLLWSVCRIGKSLVELVGFMETCRARGVALYLHEQQIDTATSNGVSLLDVAPLMVHHLRQSRRSKILKGQASARALSIKFGRPRIATIRVEKAKRELAAGKGVRQVARSAGISPASACRIKNSMNTETARS
jgi:DNA invertase Pin-like site-specific DNA recombinase